MASGKEVCFSWGSRPRVWSVGSRVAVWLQSDISPQQGSNNSSCRQAESRSDHEDTGFYSLIHSRFGAATDLKHVLGHNVADCYGSPSCLRLGLRLGSHLSVRCWALSFHLKLWQRRLQIQIKFYILLQYFKLEYVWSHEGYFFIPFHLSGCVTVDGKTSLCSLIIIQMVLSLSFAPAWFMEPDLKRVSLTCVFVCLFV